MRTTWSKHETENQELCWRNKKLKHKTLIFMYELGLNAAKRPWRWNKAVHKTLAWIEFLSVTAELERAIKVSVAGPDRHQDSDTKRLLQAKVDWNIKILTQSISLDLIYSRAQSSAGDLLRPVSYASRYRTMRHVWSETAGCLEIKQTQSFLHGAQFSLIIRLQIAFFIFQMHFNVSVAAETIIATKCALLTC